MESRIRIDAHPDGDVVLTHHVEAGLGTSLTVRIPFNARTWQEWLTSACEVTGYRPPRQAKRS